MNWRVKAIVINGVSLLPSALSYNLYYLIQKRLGSFKNNDPISRLTAGANICKKIENTGRLVKGKTFLEVGTGRRVNMPLAFFFSGAKKTITFDKNPYMEQDLIENDIKYISTYRDKVLQIFDNLLVQERFDQLVNLFEGRWNFKAFLELCNIEYIAPGDATDTLLQKNSIDYHVSYNVLEHVSPDILCSIYREGNRVIKAGGLFLHKIDFSDHFSHSDKSISSVNFLKFNDRTWGYIADNKYMYVNRLRIDDFCALVEKSNQRVLQCDLTKDDRAYELLMKDGIKLHDKFSNKTHDVLATRNAWVLSENIEQ